jgi:hypothetical protein
MLESLPNRKEVLKMADALYRLNGAAEKKLIISA